MLFSNNFEQLNCFSTLSNSFSPINSLNNPCNETNQYEKNYLKNLDLIKEKYKNIVFPALSFQKVIECTVFLLTRLHENEQDHNLQTIKMFSESKGLQNKIYYFLCALAFYEKDTHLSHDSFVIFTQ